MTLSRNINITSDLYIEIDDTTNDRETQMTAFFRPMAHFAAQRAMLTTLAATNAAATTATRFPAASTGVASPV